MVDAAEANTSRATADVQPIYRSVVVDVAATPAVGEGEGKGQRKIETAREGGEGGGDAGEGGGHVADGVVAAKADAGQAVANATNSH